MEEKNKKIGLIEAISIAVGTMIGAGIFSVLGIGAGISGRNLPLSFVIAGILTLLVAYSYTKLGARIISNAGPLEFIRKGIGDNIITGSLSILMWLSFVLSISLFIKAFAYYFLSLFGLPLNSLNVLIVEFTVLAVFTILNFFGSKLVGRAEFFIVLIKVLILILFVIIGIWFIKPEYIKPDLHIKALINTFYAATVLFLTYMGFGLITNASENIENPRKNVPRAIYLSILIVALIYISVSLVAIGNLGVEQLIKAKEYALAEATKPILGNLGFVLMSIGALFSIASAINATLYGGANVSYALAKEGKLPEVFERKVWFEATEGLFITAALSFVFAIFFHLEGISNLISFVFLTIYIFVIYSHIKLLGKVDGNRYILIFNFIVILTTYIVLMIYQFEENKNSFIMSILIIILTLIFEYFYRKLRGRSIQERGTFYEKGV